MLLYLDDIIAEETRGNSRGEVARSLVWEGIERMIAAGLLDRRRGPVSSALGVGSGDVE